jgi:hypothetical protein
MQRFLLVGLIVAGLLAPASGALADSTGNHGQPSQSCEAQPSAPPGFSTTGFSNAQNHYAGSQPQNSQNAASVSQYDVACFQVSQPPK